MDNGTIIVASISGLVALSSAVFVLIKGRGENKNKATEIQAAAVRDGFAQNIELNRYIDEKVKAATTPLVDRIAALEAREDSTKTIVRRFFQRLVFWDTTGRVGPMPMPSPADMRDLDIEDLQPKEPSNG
jgi:DNA-binding protein